MSASVVKFPREAMSCPSEFLGKPHTPTETRKDDIFQLARQLGFSVEEIGELKRVYSKVMKGAR